MTEPENADQPNALPNQPVNSQPTGGPRENQPNQNNAQPGQNDPSGQSRTGGPTQPEPTGTANQNNQNGPIAGDVILQVHIANIFLTFCQKYARLCDKRVRKRSDFIFTNLKR